MTCDHWKMTEPDTDEQHPDTCAVCCGLGYVIPEYYDRVTCHACEGRGLIDPEPEPVDPEEQRLSDPDAWAGGFAGKPLT